MRKFLFFIVSFIFFGALLSQIHAAENETDIRTLLNRMESQIELIKNSHQELRRDQLNYKIEKDLLKETYSSNIQTVNILITIVLAVFTVIGFIGIKGVQSTKEEFKKELEEIRKLRSQYEIKFKEIKDEQENTKKEYGKLVSSTENQEKRLQILEIQEKAGNYLNAGNYNRALVYTDLGLELDPHDIILLNTKMACYSKLGNFQETIKTGEVIVDKTPDDLSAIVNLCEIYLLASKNEEFDLLWKQNKTQLIKKYSLYLEWWFIFIRFVKNNDLESTKNHLLKLKKLDNDNENEKDAKLKNWGYEEAKYIIDEIDNDELKTIYSKSFKYLQGKINTEEFIKDIKPT